MTYQEKVEACRKYTSKLALLDSTELVNQVFYLNF